MRVLKNILFVLGSGGHTARALLLSELLDCKKYFIVPWESKYTKSKVNGRYFSVISPRFRAKSSKILTVLRTLLLFLHSLVILLIVRPDVVISTGSGISLPPMLIARFLHRKTVYIESPSRVYEPSITGRFLMGKTTKWLSSWKELSDKYDEVEYGGIIS